MPSCTCIARGREPLAPCREAGVVSIGVLLSVIAAVSHIFVLKMAEKPNYDCRKVVGLELKSQYQESETKTRRAP